MRKYLDNILLIAVMCLYIGGLFLVIRSNEALTKQYVQILVELKAEQVLIEGYGKEELPVDVDLGNDTWDNPIVLFPGYRSDRFIVSSNGPDGIILTDDDLMCLRYIR